MQEFIPTAEINTDAQVRILSDDKVGRRRLTQIVEKHYVRTLTFHDPESFFVGVSVPACVVIDWQAGRHDGLEIARRSRGQWPNSAVLLIWEQPSVALAVSAMRAGVDGVLEKPINALELTREIRAAIQHSQSRCTKKSASAELRQRISRISDIELEILKLVADGVPNKNIAAAKSLSLRTVEKYRHSLFESLGVNSAAEATRIWVLANLEN